MFLLKLAAASDVDLSTSSTPLSNMEISPPPPSSTSFSIIPSVKDDSTLSENAHETISMAPVEDGTTTGNVILKLQHINQIK